MRLGLDLGTNSIGWWLYKTQEANGQQEITQHITGGVRIFADGRDPKSKQSLAVNRRLARAQRRRRDRYLRRRNSLMRQLKAAGLMPSVPEAAKQLELQDPFALRTRGLDEPLSLHELGRALFHINQRRGFKSNRIADADNDESGKINTGISRLEQAMEETGARTYGEFLHQRIQQGQSARTRLGTITITNKEGLPKETSGYDFYPSRALFEQEFCDLWEQQKRYYPNVLTDTLKDHIYQVIFFQRPLKTPKVGRCLYEEEERLPKAHPLFQERRLYETINVLRITALGVSERKLKLDERDTLIFHGQNVKKLEFDKMRKLLKLSADYSFTLEKGNRKDIDGNETRALMCKHFGQGWTELSLEQQSTVIEKILHTEHTEALIIWLQEQYQLDEVQAESLVHLRLPQGYGRLGLTASTKILHILQRDVILYSEAAEEAYGSHSDFRTGEIFKTLPYYGQILQAHVIPGSFDAEKHHPVQQAAEYWGRITNPTVHIGMNQLRHLVNDIIRIYGKPDQIIVELARDLKTSEQQKKEMNQNIRKNTEAAERRGAELEKLGQINHGTNRLRLKLWEELNPMNRCCVYCGENISTTMLFNGDTDIDHILPFSRTLDDSQANKVVVHSHCNRQKINHTPWEAWGQNTDRWQRILSAVQHLPENKRRRFQPDAMERFTEENDFLARQLKDTQYLARMAHQYLAYLYPEKGKGSQHVWVVPGRLTEMIRRNWGLNDLLTDKHKKTYSAKNRQDHRHHAIDAAVVAATDRSLLKKIARAAAESEVAGAERIVFGETVPWQTYRSEMGYILKHIVVSHKMDHGTVSQNRQAIQDQTAAQLHNETAYGFTGETNAKDIPIVVTRKPFASLESTKDIAKIRDPHLRNELLTRIDTLDSKTSIKAALQEFAASSRNYQGIRHVRIEEALQVIPIKNKSGKVYKGYKGDSNHCIEVWQLPGVANKWQAALLTTFDAHQKGKGLGSTRPHPAAKLVMRLFKKDSVFVDHPQHGKDIYVIAKFSANGTIALFPHNEANVDARTRDKEEDFNYVTVGFGSFKKYRLHKIGINRLGQVTGISV